MSSPLHKWLFSPSPSSVSLPLHEKPLSEPSPSVFSPSLVNVESRRPRPPNARMSGRAHSSVLANMKPIDIEAANAPGNYPEKRSPLLLSPLFSPMLKAKVAYYVPLPVRRLLAVLAAFLLFATVSKYGASLAAASTPVPTQRVAFNRDYSPPQGVRAPGEFSLSITAPPCSTRNSQGVHIHSIRHCPKQAFEGVEDGMGSFGLLTAVPLKSSGHTPVAAFREPGCDRFRYCYEIARVPGP